jgi:palmitoyl transferase
MVLIASAAPALAQDASASAPVPEDSSSAAASSSSKGGFWWALGQTTPAGAVDPATPYENWWKRLWDGQKLIRADGGYDIFVSGYAWHPPTSYDEDKKDDLNEKAWGTGIGRTINAANGQHRSFYLFVSEDSHNDPQVMLGYSWLARTPSAGGLRLGAGYTFMMIGRDEFGYLPVPFATPLFTLDVGPVQTILSYVPKYDVWYVFGRIAVRGQRSVRAANPPESSRVASRAATR